MAQAHDLDGLYYDAADGSFCRLRQYDGEPEVYFYTPDMEDCYYEESIEKLDMSDFERVEEQAVEDPATYFEACIVSLMGNHPDMSASFMWADRQTEITEVSDD